MKKRKRFNMLLTIMILFSMCITFQPVVYAATIPYSGIEVSSGQSSPMNVVIGPNGKLYVAEYGGNKIVQMDRDGGNKTDYATGMSQPIGMVFDADGNLYVAEHNGSKVTKVEPNGNKTLVKFTSGDYLTGITLNSEGKIFVAGYSCGKIYKMNTDGTEYSEFVTGLPKTSIIGMTIDQDDNLYVSDQSNSKIRKIEPSGKVSDFLTNVSRPYWITLGKDGFFYVASGKTIVKVNSSGTIVETFSTGELNSWGMSVDAGGYIYFTELSSTTKKIVGSAATSNTEQINLTMNTVLSSMDTDPTAFSVSGVASNPEVIGAAVSGSSINLTLSQGMTALDNNIKVNYRRTGTNNITVTGSVYEIDDFSNLPVINNISSVIIDQSAPTGLTGIAPTSSANNEGRITGTTTQMEYKLSSSGTWLAVTAAEITGLSAETYNVRYAAKTGFNASPSINVIVPEYTATNQAQDAPTGLTGIAPTSSANNEGRITGVTTEMEYKLSSSGTWIAVTAVEITGLSAETYNVRYAAKTGFNASPSVNVIVPEYTAPSTGGGSGGGGGNVSTSYTITVSAGKDGSISPASASMVKGEDKTFSITADKGYEITDVKVDGISVGAVSNYTFSNVSANHTIAAVFTKVAGLQYYIDRNGKKIFISSAEVVGLPYYIDGNGKKVFIGFASDTSGVMKYIALSSVTVLFQENPKSFTDIADNWAKDNINFVTEREIFVGTGSSIFSPNTGMTRGMFVTVIGRLDERSYGSIKGNTIFSDVDTDAYYTKYVAWAHENKIIYGVGNNKFAPNTEVTREQMAAIMFNYATYLGKVSEDNKMTNITYHDQANIADWALNSASYCQLTGIITGRDGGKFAPKATATRAEVTAVIERFVKEILK